ncbi:ABC transporter permease [Listeria sp. FSL L7-1582]|uniref:ABC transporter permease n=1 Tax=Listeria portnoyi TaxID=2713504 RepID=UPI00164DA522|nr:ABC transporter permease [Listeria portnoyi]MBC6309828.1 ABC transporter permease [Listeria portnoyi]
MITNIWGFCLLYARRTIKIPMIPIFLFIFPIVILVAILLKQQGTLDTHTYEAVAHQLIGGLSIVCILVVTIVNVPIVIVNAKMTSLFKRLKFSKVTQKEYFLALYISNLLFALVAEIFLLVESIFIFDVSFSANQLIGIILPFLLVYTFYFIFGVAIAGFCNNLEQNQVVILPIYFGLLLLSGSFIPFDSLPSNIANYLVDFNPFYLFTQVLNSAHAKMNYFTDIRTYIIIVIAFVCILLIRRQYRRG